MDNEHQIGPLKSMKLTDRPWLIRFKGVFSYEESFACVEHPGLADFIKQRKKEKGLLPVAALDLLSEWIALQELESAGLDIGACVGKASQINIKEFSWIRNFTDINSNDPSKSEIKSIYGDILVKSTWDKVDKFLLDRRMFGFDLIMSRGIGPLDNLPTHPRMLYVLLQKAYARLAGDGGMMLLQVPRTAGQYLDAVQKSTEAVKSLDFRWGVHVNTNNKDHLMYPVIYVRKHAGAPERFPISEEMREIGKK